MTAALLTSWSFRPWLLLACTLAGLVYIRGWRNLRRHTPERWSCLRPTAFLAGVAVLYVALASPIDSFASLLIQAHMAQHLLLMMAVPPLIWLGRPMVPMLRGLPAAVRTVWIVPFFQQTVVQRLAGFLTHPFTAFGLLTATTWLWHWPPLYELALRNSSWHFTQHAAFLFAGLLFWYAVILPYPSRPMWPRWLIVPALFLADIQNTILAAMLTLSDRVMYPYYDQMPRLGTTALRDQSAAGVLMWVPGSIAFLLPMAWLAWQLLTGRALHTFATSRIRLPVVPAAPSLDLLQVPLLGRTLRWTYTPIGLQIAFLAISIVVIVDGLTGPDVSPMNLAGILPWIHWRGVLIIALIMLGNVFCMACPFTLPRSCVRKFFAPPLTWPSWMSSKWLACGLLIAFFWAYESFSLWDRPGATAWLAIGYFAGATAIDGLFRGASFCKYVCPVGQFNFVQSLVSPAGIMVREPAECGRCQTKDCIRGQAMTSIRGCELQLHVPSKSNNMDCTLCLDCVRACQHDNVGLPLRWPTQSLPTAARQWSSRPDVAMMVLVLTFGAFANAAAMVVPVLAAIDATGYLIGLSSAFLPNSVFFALTTVVSPGLLVLLANRSKSLVYCYSVVPLGFAMWLCHYSFHLVTSYDTISPVVMRLLNGFGVDAGDPDWVRSCCRPVGDWLPRAEIVFLGLGLLASLYSLNRLADRQGKRPTGELLAWSILSVALYGLGCWIVLQPMQMRGTLSAG